MKFSIKDQFSKCDQICSFLRMWSHVLKRIWSHVLKKSLIKNFIFCAVSEQWFLKSAVCEVSMVIREKGESQNGCFKKTKHDKLSEKRTFHVRGKKCSFFGKFGVLCSLKTPVFRFALLLYYRRFVEQLHPV